MENITITSMTDKKFGKPDTTTGQAPAFWGVTLSDGRKATIWDETIQAGVAANIGNSAMAEIKGNGTFLNIRSFIVNKKGDGIPTPNNIKDMTLSKETSTADSIVAQVCVKGAIELAKKLGMDELQNNETLGQFLCMAVVEIAGAYKIALKQLEL